MVTAKKSPVKVAATAPKEKTVAKKTVSAPKAVAAPAPVVKKVAAKKTGAAKASGGATAARPAVSAEQRHNYIEVAAFYVAQRRGFAPGNPFDDWAMAEVEVDQLILSGHFSK